MTTPSAGGQHGLVGRNGAGTDDEPDRNQQEDGYGGARPGTGAHGRRLQVITYRPQPALESEAPDRGLDQPV
jgi:hypothetical protein